ncbi:TATA box-binding protein-associated factor RNA polymerase I subunit C [Phyllobates terribilis]|uniref:TATA box-binding protein-associated factor RNA polymerase I subunit C n=1 Tax=Phyllobates terribilis TaxID=111132 RepID=UPI003CCA905B
MDFPSPLFPGFFQKGSTNREAADVTSVLGWGERGRVLETGRAPDKDYGPFIPLYSRERQHWTPAEMVPSPLLPPNTDCDFPPVTEFDLVYRKTKSVHHTKPEVAGVSFAFSKQISRFCWDHSSIAFQCMGRVLEPHCYMGDHSLMGKIRERMHRMTSLRETLQTAPLQDCPFSHNSYLARSFSYFTGDWIHDVPPGLLAELVNGGMAEDWRKLQFQGSLTGGALSWTSYPGTSYGCLIYPRGAAMNQLYFQQCLVDECHELGVKLLGDAAVYELKERIQQVSTGQHEQVMVGARAAFHLACWSFSAQDPPNPLCALKTTTRSTCINASPHIPAEFCVCMDSGTLYLWSVETGLQRVRQDPDSMFFRDDPHWRWSDFTSHPRVLSFADRTGVQIADIRVPNSQGAALFRIGQESSCQRGERVILPRCLREINPASYLVGTQFSLYIMDERFPLVPLAKWDHMLEGPPSYISVSPAGASACTNTILLGTQHSQETLLVQFSGGHSSSCQLHLPGTRLPRISQSLHHLSPLLPHHRDLAVQRLQSPLAGLAAASPESSDDHLLVFQSTMAGDLFIQRLSQEVADPPLRINAIGLQPPVSDSAPEEPAADHHCHSVPEDELVSFSARSGQQGAGAQSFLRWLNDFYRACPWRGVAARPRCQIHKIFVSEKLSVSSPELAGLREHLRDSMKVGSLIPSLAAPTSHKLESVHTESWKDTLSHRLTASWEGRLGIWWVDYLGANKESKIRMLREKRRRQKMRRSLSRSSLSGSFTSSVPSDLYDRDPFSPWSCDSALDSATSAGLAPVSCASQDSAADPSQVLADSSLPHNSSATSSQSLRAKGIPHERRQTLRDFLSFLEDCPSAVPQPELPVTDSQSLSVSQRSQPPSKRSRMGF